MLYDHLSRFRLLARSRYVLLSDFRWQTALLCSDDLGERLVTLGGFRV